IQMHDAVVRLKLCLLADSRLDKFPEAGLVVGVNPLKEFFQSGQTILWIETQNTVAFLPPVRLTLVWTPCPTSHVSEALPFAEIKLASLQFPLQRCLCVLGARDCCHVGSGAAIATEFSVGVKHWLAAGLHIDGRAVTARGAIYEVTERLT